MSGRARQLLRTAPFECAVVVVAIVYVGLHLSPSSYSLALRELGEPSQPTLGVPRAIRTDEWAVQTPLFQAAVNNDFRQTNETSFYRESLRSHIGLPVRDWGALFKPLVWGFFVLPPALAYSIYWASIGLLMLTGWSLLLRALGFSIGAAALLSLLLFFSPLVQAWSWMVFVAFFPWLLLAIVRIRSEIMLAGILTVLVPTWWLSNFYVPAIPPLAYLGLALVLALRPSVLTIRRTIAVTIGVVLGGLISFVYFGPVFSAYANSVYPGDRWTTGGDLPAWQVLSQVLPGATTEAFVPIVGANISEAATIATWLPLFAACIVDYPRVAKVYRCDAGLRRNLRGVAILATAWILLTMWQLTPISPLSYGLGLGLSPEARTLFASGALLVIGSGYALDKLPLRINALRVALFSALVVLAWMAASHELHPGEGLSLRDELLVLLPSAVLAIGVVTRGEPKHHMRSIAALLVVLLPVISVWSMFNPIQSTRVMFRKPDTEITRRIDKLARRRSDAAVAVSDAPGAILNGVGYRSVRHVLTVPSPELFRRFFQSYGEREFNQIFNRYAHINLTTSRRALVVQQDTIALPLDVMRNYAATP